MVKEALHIQKTPANNRLNYDGYKLWGCWIATMKKLGGIVNTSHTSASCISILTSALDHMHMEAQEPCL